MEHSKNLCYLSHIIIYLAITGRDMPGVQMQVQTNQLTQPFIPNALPAPPTPTPRKKNTFRSTKLVFPCHSPRKVTYLCFEI